MMPAISLVNTSRNACRSTIGSGSTSQDLLGDDMIVCSHFRNCDWFKRCEFRIHFWKISIYNVGKRHVKTEWIKLILFFK